MANQLSRRTLLKGSALLTTASVLGFSGVFGFRSALAAEDDVATIINIAATAETFATTHYYRALTTKALTMSDPIKLYFAAALYAEFQHLKFLQSNGAKAVQTKFYFPAITFKDLKSLGTVTSIAETVFVGAYIAATHRFAELNNANLAAVAAQVAVVEGEHLMFVRQLAGEKLPNNIVLANPIFYQVSDALPVVQPLLDGKKPADGPLSVDFETSAFDYPGDDTVSALIAKLLDMKLIDSSIKPFTQLVDTGAATDNGTDVPTEAATEAH